MLIVFVNELRFNAEECTKSRKVVVLTGYFEQAKTQCKRPTAMNESFINYLKFIYFCLKNVMETFALTISRFRRDGNFL